MTRQRLLASPVLSRSTLTETTISLPNALGYPERASGAIRGLKWLPWLLLCMVGCTSSSVHQIRCVAPCAAQMNLPGTYVIRVRDSTVPIVAWTVTSWVDGNVVSDED